MAVPAAGAARLPGGRFLSAPAALPGPFRAPDQVFDRFSCDLTAIPELFPKAKAPDESPGPLSYFGPGFGGKESLEGYCPKMAKKFIENCKKYCL